MVRPLKRKAAEISSSPTVADKKQGNSKTSKKSKREDAKPTPKARGTEASSSNTTRLTRSSSNKIDPGTVSAKAFSTGTSGRQKKNSSKDPAKVTKSSSSKPTKLADESDHSQSHVVVPRNSGKIKAKKKIQKRVDAEDSENEANVDGHQYWLLKAEPESRIEKGKDVKFSIDDLKASSSPEPWDGVRNLEARNNMRAMTKGDLAFFYHSNCKVPGIVGIMEIAEEHSVDESAFDVNHPYYDEKSSRESPKWHLVHVAFKQKFPEMITLKELQKFSKDGGVLENMQVVRRGRLSVSKVTKKEWDFIMSLVDSEDEALDSAPQAEGLSEAKLNGLPSALPVANGPKPAQAESTSDAIASKEEQDSAKSTGETKPSTSLPNTDVAA